MNSQWGVWDTQHLAGHLHDAALPLMWRLPDHEIRSKVRTDSIKDFRNKNISVRKVRKGVSNHRPRFPLFFFFKLCTGSLPYLENILSGISGQASRLRLTRELMI